MQENRRKARVAILHAMNPASGAARELKLSVSECSIGSEESNEVVVRDGSVSSRHARFRRRWRKWQIVDTGSSNGTYVASQRVTRWTTLRDGQEVRLGGARFVFHSAARVTSGLSLLQRFSKLRAILAVVVTALVVGFAGTQFLLYRKYHRELAASKTERNGRETIGMNPGAGTPSESSNTPPEKEVPALAWLERVNYWRDLAGLSSLPNSTDLSAAAEKHAKYLVKHALQGKLGELASGGAHTEDKSDPWYSQDGLAAAQSGDVVPPCKGCPLLSGSQQIDNLIVVPFHRLPILDPQIKKIGFGSYTEGGLQATVVYLPIRQSNGVFDKPIEFPPKGSSVEFAVFQSEWPDPLSSCPEYSPPAGLPITLALGKSLDPHVSDYSLKVGDQTLEVCMFQDSTYRNPDAAAQERVRSVLKGYGTVVLIPRQPLASGQSYSVSINANEKNYSWSFNVD
jgi:hypothetical protein